MSENKKFKGPWIQRAAIVFLGLILGVLLYWLLGFITRDIGSLRGPDFSIVQAKYVNAQLRENQKSLEEKLAALNKQIGNKRGRQNILEKGTRSLQTTINQLLSIQKLNIERNLTLPEQQQKVLVDSQTMFLENQKEFQVLNKEIGELTKQQDQLKEELDAVSEQIQSQLNVARTEYNELMTRHRWKLAALKLAVLIPIFLSLIHI